MFVVAISRKRIRGHALPWNFPEAWSFLDVTFETDFSSLAVSLGKGGTPNEVVFIDVPRIAADH